MPTIPLLERIAQPGQPLLADGATGTLIHARAGASIDECFDAFNLTRPDLVLDIHRAYLKAGAELIETNTFSANRLKLAEYGLDDQVSAINRAGVELARQAIRESGRDDTYIAGSVGPLGTGIAPYGRLKPEEAAAIMREQIDALAAAGVDALIFETFHDLDELVLAIRTARAAAPPLPIIAEMTFGVDDRTRIGHNPARAARDLHEAGADVIGVNCSGGPAQISRVIQAMIAAVPGARFSAMPNAGFPQSVSGRTMYPATTDYFADFAAAAKSLGVQIIGGCCGTTPAHTAAMRAALDDPARKTTVFRVKLARTDEPEGAETASPAEQGRGSELARKLAAGEFVITVEMAPPRSHNLEKMVDSARLLMDAGATTLDIADSPTARMRVSAWAVCSLIESRLGIETILHFPVRGRNLLRIQGDLLGAHAIGLRNLFVCMGDPTRIGDYPDANDQFDIAPSALIHLTTHKMNAGTDQAGNSIGTPTRFTVGCALNMGAPDPDKEIDVLRKKIDAGADFALGQPVFEPHLAERFLERYHAVTGEPLRLPVLMGVMPLYSLKHALYLHNEIPGISIPDAILKRMEAAEDAAAQEGVRIAGELLQHMRPLVQGAYIIPSFGKYGLAAQVIETALERA
ncbi:MAG: bifunctional homocysteine S-methyltransferase/methylenetetrahydrofolate reductase [bacterium]|nr:bifunctional homocysteine S-methyltransferase/methylenetetrahydrofolate reductase [bacterium]